MLLSFRRRINAVLQNAPFVQLKRCAAFFEFFRNLLKIVFQHIVNSVLDDGWISPLAAFCCPQIGPISSFVSRLFFVFVLREIVFLIFEH